MTTLHDPHYLRHVTELGQKRAVIAHQAIYSQTGMKLVDVGTRVTAALFDKLVKHKLLPPIDQCLSVEGAVSTASLRRELESLLLDTKAFGVLETNPAEHNSLMEIFEKLPLTPQLAFKLTVMHEQRPDILRHSLQVTLVALFLAVAAGHSEAELMPVIAASLFHDVGLLHIDPIVLQEENYLDDDQQRQLDSHPIPAYLILKAIPEWNPLVSVAVLEHHERRDASGYPRRLPGESLGALGQLIAVAELGAAILWKRGQTAYAHLSVALRFNEDKLNQQYAGKLTELLWKGEMRYDAKIGVAPARVREEFRKIAAAMKVLQNFDSHVPADSAWKELPLLVNERLEQLVRSMARTGIDLNQDAEHLIDEEGDAAELLELHCIATEALWQLKAITREIRRRLWNLPTSNQAIAMYLRDWVAHTERDLGSAIAGNAPTTAFGDHP